MTVTFPHIRRHREVKKNHLFLAATLLACVFLVFLFFSNSPHHIKVSLASYSDAITPKILYDGEIGSAPLLDPSCLSFAISSASVGMNSSVGIILQPDKWNGSKFKLFCGGGSISPRVDFGPYTNLDFDIKSSTSASSTRNFWLTSWDFTGATISLADYVDGGIIDNTWRHVSIPLTALTAPGWTMNDVENLVFDVDDGTGNLYYIDNIALHKYVVDTGATNQAPVIASLPVGTSTVALSDTLALAPTVTDDGLPTGSSLSYVWTEVSGSGTATFSSPTTAATNVNFSAVGTYSLLLTVSDTLLTTTANVGVVVTSQLATSTNGTLIWDGESTASRAVVFAAGMATSSTSANGSYSFEGDPQQYVWSGINLSGLPMFRQDLSNYNEIQFYAKASTQNAVINFQLQTYVGSQNLTSNIVNIAPYIQGGTLDTMWHLVTIPVSVLENSSFDMTSVDNIYFGNAVPNDGHQIFIDDIYAVDTNPVSISNVVPLSNKVVKISTNDSYDMSAALSVLNYSLQSSDDSNFSSPINPVSVGRESYITDFKGSGTPVGGVYGSPGAPVVDYNIYLVFNQGMVSGSHYTLTINDIKSNFGVDFSSATTTSIDWNDENFVTGTVKASDVGYIPQSPKFGYIGNYLGDAGAMNISPTTCSLNDAATNATVFSTNTTYSGDYTQFSGEKLYQCDFSSFTTPGNYYLTSPGLGKSYNFTIGSDAFNDVASATERFLYYQRDDTDLLSQYAGVWARAGGHMHTDKVAQIDVSQLNSSLYDGEVIGSTVDMTGGWYDAGDYGKYSYSGAFGLSDIFQAFELYPQKFGDNTNIPESGNGVPDILDEAKWETDWLRNMQAPDGGVYVKVTTLDWATTMPSLDLETRLISEKDTHITAQYAAVMAEAYRAFLPYFPAYASDLLARSEKAWTFLVAHPAMVTFSSYGVGVNPPTIGGGANADAGTDRDERAWAAAELYKSTGDQQYLTAFNTYWDPALADYGENDWDSWKRASFAYATTYAYPTDPAKVTIYKTALKTDMDALVATTNSNPYHAAYPSTIAYIGFGSFSRTASVYAFDLIKASFLLNDPKYLAAAESNVDIELGSNPQYRSYITGIGENYPMHPLSTISALDGITEPVPGIAVYGVVGSLGVSNPYLLSVSQNLYPAGTTDTDPYPILRRFFDVSADGYMTEFDISSSPRIAAVFAFLANNNDQAAATSTTPVSVNATAPPVHLYSQSSQQLPAQQIQTTQIQTTTSVTSIEPEQQSNSSIIASSHALAYGSSSPAVMALQIFLNTNGFPLAPSGVGSSGQETSYFGPLTNAAVDKLQLKYNVVKSSSSPGYGIVGPITRAVIALINAETK